MTRQENRPLLLAHYMPWFVAQPERDTWGWHWTMNAFDPKRVTNGKREIASHYYPLIGAYDSGDPAVIEYHLLLMKLAGIDGVIVDWYGVSDFADYTTLHRNTRALCDAAATMNLMVGICYEDQTITHRVVGKRLSADDRIPAARRDLDALRDTFFPRPNYWRIDGRPVLLSFGESGLTDPEWAQLLRSVPNAPLYLSEHRRRRAAVGTFDWPEPSLGLRGLDAYYASVRGQTLFLPVAFPRFNDIYKAAKVSDGYPEIPDDGGRTFARSLERAMQSGAPAVQIATWNDWGEGTIIEPSLEFGFRDLEAVQRQRRAVDARFAPTPEDLRLPLRLWQSRTGSRLPSAVLDGIVRQILTGDLPAARAALAKLVPNRPLP